MTALRAALPAATDKVATAISALTADDLHRLGAWQALADLSTHTTLEAIDGDPDAVTIDGSTFEAIANVYVLLSYGSGKDGDAFSDEYIATIGGVIDGDHATVTAAAVDVTPFYD